MLPSRASPRLAFCAGSDRYHEYCEELIISSRGVKVEVEVEVEGEEEDVKKMKKMKQKKQKKQKKKQKRRRRRDLST